MHAHTHNFPNHKLYLLILIKQAVLELEGEHWLRSVKPYSDVVLTLSNWDVSVQSFPHM